MKMLTSFLSRRAKGNDGCKEKEENNECNQHHYSDQHVMRRSLFRGKSKELHQKRPFGRRHVKCAARSCDWNSLVSRKQNWTSWIMQNGFKCGWRSRNGSSPTGGTCHHLDRKVTWIHWNNYANFNELNQGMWFSWWQFWKIKLQAN